MAFVSLKRQATNSHIIVCHIYHYHGIMPTVVNSEWPFSLSIPPLSLSLSQRESSTLRLCLSSIRGAPAPSGGKDSGDGGEELDLKPGCFLPRYSYTARALCKKVSLSLSLWFRSLATERASLLAAEGFHLLQSWPFRYPLRSLFP